MTYHTDRLALRPIEERDIDAMLATRTIPEVVEFTYEPIWTREYAAERVARHARLSHEESPVFTRWMIELRESDDVIGDIYLSKDAELQGTTEIGYVIHPDYAGNGYATEAAREALRIGFRSGVFIVSMPASMKTIRDQREYVSTWECDWRRG